MHALYGRLPWADVLQPAVEIARRGFRIPPQLKYAMDTLGDKLCDAPRLGDAYCPGGVMKELGDTVRLPELADTLEQIAVHGADAFYSGPIAERTVATVRERGGILDLADLQRFRVLFRAAQSIDYRGRYRIWSTTAPSSGAVLLSALRTLENYPDRPYDRHDVLQTHRAIEAAKFAYGERTRYGDPAYLSNVSAYEHDALSYEGGRRRFTKIDDTRTFPASYYNPSYEDSGEDHGTSHINAVDASGMAVSITTTINLWWGSLVQTPDGILLNDDMDDFSTPGTPNKFGYKPSPANYIEARKRPLSSMSPLLIESLPSGETQLIAGSAGGSRIITANLQMAYTFLSHHGRVDMQEVIRHPRWHHQLMPAETFFEYAIAELPDVHGYSNVYVATFLTQYRRGPRRPGAHPRVDHARLVGRAGDPAPRERLVGDRERVAAARGARRRRVSPLVAQRAHPHPRKHQAGEQAADVPDRVDVVVLAREARRVQLVREDARDAHARRHGHHVEQQEERIRPHRRKRRQDRIHRPARAERHGEAAAAQRLLLAVQNRVDNVRPREARQRRGEPRTDVQREHLRRADDGQQRGRRERKRQHVERKVRYVLVAEARRE